MITATSDKRRSAQHSIYKAMALVGIVQHDYPGNESLFMASARLHAASDALRGRYALSADQKVSLLNRAVLKLSQSLASAAHASQAISGDAEAAQLIDYARDAMLAATFSVNAVLAMGELTEDN